MRPAAELYRLGDAAQVVVHDHHVGGFHRRVGAGSAHGKAYVGPRQRRSVVDAVARHGRGSVARAHFLDGRELVLRQQAAACIGDARLAGHGLGGGGVVARQHDRGDAQALELRHRRHRTGLDRVGHGKQSENAAVVGQQRHGAALGFMRQQFCFQLRVGLVALADQAVIGQNHHPAVHGALHATTQQGRESLDLRCLARYAQRNRLGNRVVGACRQALGPTPHLCLVGLAPDPGCHQLGLALSQGAGLVQCHGLEQAGVFQVGAALDQDAAARRCRQAADHGHRCGDHQRAGAGNHQQHQGFVDRGQPFPVEQQRRKHGNRQCHGKDGGRIDRRKAVHKALRWRTRALRFLHGVDDARQSGVGRGGGHAELEFTVFVDGAGKHLAARLLVHRNAFSGHRRLVDAAAALGHHAVEGDALAGLDAGNGIHCHLGGLDALPAAVGLLDLGIVGSEIDQTLDGVARAVHGTRFYEFRNRVQGHDHRGFGPLANDERSRDRHRHQGVDVELAVAQRGQSLGIGLQAGQPDCRGRQRHARGLPDRGFGCKEGDALRDQGKDQRRRIARIAGAVGRCVGGITASAGRSLHGHGRETGLADAGQRSCHRIVAALDPQGPLVEAKVQAPDPGDGLDRLANLRFLDRAIHG